MKIIGTIPHAVLKITVFKTEDRLSVKFEAASMEQTFKFRVRQYLNDFDDVTDLVDHQMLESVLENFKYMLKTGEKALLRHVPPNEADEFEEII